MVLMRADGMIRMLAEDNPDWLEAAMASETQQLSPALGFLPSQTWPLTPGSLPANHIPVGRLPECSLRLSVLPETQHSRL